MRAEFPHVIQYDPAMPLSIDEIAQNLIAQHRLLLRITPLLENIFPGLEVSSVEVRLKALESSSLREEFLLALVLAYQEDVEHSVIEFIEAIFGKDIPEPYEWVITLLVLLATLTVAQHIYRRVFPQKDPEALKKDYRTILNITAERININAADLDDAITKAVSPRERRNLTRSVVNFFRPAQKGADSRIDAGDTPTQAIRPV